MSDSFRLSLYTTTKLSEAAVSQELWTLLARPLISPQSFDTVEHTEMPFRTGAYAAAAELYDNAGSLFIKGQSDSFLAHFSRESNWLSIWDFYVTLDAVANSTNNKWLQWFFMVCKAFPVLFGYGCSAEEHTAKHRVRRPSPGGGRVTGWAGISTAEFTQYLPGLYWLTIFGADLAQFFGQNLLSLPGTKAVQIGANQVAIYLDDPVRPPSMEARLRKESTLAEALGAQFFFDRSRTGVKFEPVPTLQKTLGRFGQ